MSKQKAWIQYTKKGSIVPGSLIVSANRPKNGTWYEVIENICCDTEPPFGVISSKKKAFVKYDSQGNIVPGSLIVTGKLPKPGIWKEVVINACCSTGNIVNKWYLFNAFAPAELNGAITFPNHLLSEGSLDPNQVGVVDGEVQIYINIFDQAGVDNSAELLQLVDNYGNLTLTQGTNSVTYYFIPGAFNTLTFPGATNLFADNVYGTSPFGSISVVSPASGPFNETDPISITVSILTPTSKYYNVAGCERMEYHVIEYTGNDALIDGTIVSNDTPECWYVTTETANTPDVGTISTIWSTSGECTSCNTIQINCDQTWTNRNLDVTTYRNGDEIPQVTNPTQWSNLTTGAWCYYGNLTTNGPIYGKMYNWYAVNDPRGIAPEGWHIPTDAEWTILETCLGGQSVAGGKLRETGTTHWQTPNAGATNSSGLTLLPGGNRTGANGGFNSDGQNSIWWTSTEVNSTTVYSRFTYFGDTFSRTDIIDKRAGAYIRIIKD